MSHPECQVTNGPQRDEQVAGESTRVSSGVLETLIATSPEQLPDGSMTHRTVDGRSGQVHGALIGTVTGWNETGQPLVLADEISEFACPARTVVDAMTLQTGTQVVLLFEQGDPERPIVMAALSDTQTNSTPNGAATNLQRPPLADANVEATVDNDRLVLQADREIVLKCGQASITLTRAGKVILRGAYVLSRSSGVNRIKGGSVQIN